MANIKNLVGKKFNKLTVIDFAYIKKKHTYWQCICECGNIAIIESYNLKSGNTKSCGCYFKKIVKKANTKHGLSDTKFYNSWLSMKYRCNNINNSDYYNYGGRGINVCDRWMESFNNFKEDMYQSYLEHVEKFGESDTSIDRIDVDGNYEPNNCKWARWKEQGGNRQINREFIAISPSGEEFISKNKRECSIICNISSKHISEVLDCKINNYNRWTFKYVYRL